jgi:hypothetical protein
MELPDREFAPQQLGQDHDCLRCRWWDQIRPTRRVPTEYATSERKAYLAEYILKAAAQGHTTYNELVAAAGDQIQIITAALT